MTQKSLAQAMEVSNKSIVSKIESGQRSLSSLELFSISTILDVPLDEFITLEKSPILLLLFSDFDKRETFFDVIDKKGKVSEEELAEFMTIIKTGEAKVCMDTSILRGGKK